MCPRHAVLLIPAAAEVCFPSVYLEQRRVTPLESTLVEVFILSTLNPFRMNTCRAKPHFAQFWCNVSPFRINTCKVYQNKRLYLRLESTLMKKQGVGDRF